MLCNVHRRASSLPADESTATRIFLPEVVAPPCCLGDNILCLQPIRTRSPATTKSSAAARRSCRLQITRSRPEASNLLGVDAYVQLARCYVESVECLTVDSKSAQLLKKSRNCAVNAYCDVCTLAEDIMIMILSLLHKQYSICKDTEESSKLKSQKAKCHL